MFRRSGGESEWTLRLRGPFDAQLVSPVCTRHQGCNRSGGGDNDRGRCRRAGFMADGAPEAEAETLNEVDEVDEELVR